MSNNDRNNPSDASGNFQSQSNLIGTVVDIKDPEKRGRVRVRTAEDDQQKIPDDKLPWRQCLSQSAQLRGIGKFPHHNYLCGTKVMLTSLGGQGFIVTGSVGNNEKDKRNQDSTSETDNAGTPFKRFPIPKTPWVEKLIDGKWIGELKGTKDAYGLLNFLAGANYQPDQSIRKTVQDLSGIPNYLGQRLGNKPNDLNVPSFGSFPINLGNVANPQQYINQILGGKTLIPNATNILESLKKAAESGNPIAAMEAIGGIGNFLGAIKGILSQVKSASKNNDNNNPTILTLYQIYKQETNKDALDQNGNETEEYKKWLDEYLMRGIEAPSS
jgi:hypothetical protein